MTPECILSTDPTNAGYAYLGGLLPGSKYYFRIEATSSGNTVNTPLQYFKTQGIALFGKSAGFLTRTADQSGETAYGYDQQGRTVTRRAIMNDVSKIYFTRYGYDRADNLTSIIYPDGDYKELTYDKYNRLAGMINREGKIIKSFGYTAAGACSTENYLNGVNGVFAYYPRLWLKEARYEKFGKDIFRHGYGYDPIGNLVVDNDKPGGLVRSTRNYVYDKLNRLNNENSDLGYNLSYQYDAMGNRTQAGTTAYQYYSGTNRLEKEIAADGLEKTYGYDANGNLNNDGIWSYEYDAQNKLKKVYKYVSNGSTNIEYLYNASGLRIKEKKTDVISNTNAALDAATFPETFDDLVLNAPSGDGHDDARDLGKLKVHVSDSFLFFTIEHKYLYGTSQGDYENIYIALDTDQEFGSGSTLLPDGIKVSVSADNAWEYCAYVYSEKDFGIYIGEGFKLENLTTAGGKKMKVNFTNGNNSKAIIK
ncbi:MAG: hypothetical protein AB1599_10910, partial [Planctomycetota bacterium]